MIKNKIIKMLIFFVLIIAAIPNISNATSKRYYDYTIEKYNIDMIVNEDNTFDITETITTYFNVSKHGIFRKIPLKNEVKRLDGTISKNKAQITNIKVVGDSFKTYNEDGYKVIKIGDAYDTIKGNHTYTIKYTYNIGKDPLKNADELYFNLIGEEWDTIISNISFNITMPKEFDKTLLGFSSGEVGSTYNTNISYNVNGNIISGKVNDTLNPGEALTVRLELPEGYFVGAGHKADSVAVFTIALCVVSILIAYKIWSKYGKDYEVIETVEFYPPEGLNSAEIGFLYEGTASNESVISLLIYLANKGYLKIEDISEQNIYDSVEMSKEAQENAKLKIQELENKKVVRYRIVKLKEYYGNNKYEKIFFEGLFINGFRNFVTIEDLHNNFYKTLNTIKMRLNSKENKDKIFETTAKRKWLILMIIAIFLLITINPMIKYSAENGWIAEIDSEEIVPFALIVTATGFFILLICKENLVKLKIWGLIWVLGTCGIPCGVIILPCLLEDIVYLITYFIGIASITAIMIFLKIMPRRTKYGSEILGKIRGFKHFLETAEKEQLESLVMKEPEYFYNILPYTYALGVSDKWINQFETIALKAPNWSNIDNQFSINDFGTFINSAMSSVSRAMVSKPISYSTSGSPSSDSSSSISSSGGGSFGGGSFGGGSSGGGSGGGGGGSW